MPLERAISRRVTLTTEYQTFFLSENVSFLYEMSIDWKRPKTFPEALGMRHVLARTESIFAKLTRRPVAMILLANTCRNKTKLQGKLASLEINDTHGLEACKLNT